MIKQHGRRDSVWSVLIRRLPPQLLAANSAERAVDHLVPIVHRGGTKP